MKMDELFEEYDCDTEHRVQAIFSSIFILQNRMQTAGEKLQTEIFLKQWLLLAMTACCLVHRIISNQPYNLPDFPSASLLSIGVAPTTPHSSALHMKNHSALYG